MSGFSRSMRVAGPSRTRRGGGVYHVVCNSDVRMFSTWFNLAMLAADCQQDILLRSMRLAQGGRRAKREASRMISEKVIAAANASQRVMLGASPKSVVSL